MNDEEPRPSSGDEAPAADAGEGAEERRPWGEAPREERRRILLEALSKTMQDAGSGESPWGDNASVIPLLSFIHGAFYSLRHYIEDDERADVSWASPAVTLEYEIPWASFKRPAVGPAVWAPEDEPADADLETTDAAIAWAPDAFLKVSARAVLHVLTHGAFYEERRGELVAYLPRDKVDAPWAEVAPLFRPWTLGGEAGDAWWQGFLAEHGAIHAGPEEPVDADLPSFTVRVAVTEEEPDAGEPFTCDVHPVAAVYPPVVERKAKRAYYPVAVGLVAEGKPLAEWPPAVRERLWEELFGALTRLAEELEGAPPATLEGAAVNVTATAEGAAALVKPPAPKKRGRPKRLPADVKQQTYPEIAALGYAVADAPTFRNWSEAPGGDALVHARKSGPLSVRFELPPAPGAWGAEPLSAFSLKDALLAAGGIDTYLLAQVGAFLALCETQVTIALDDLIRMLGWNPRSSRERAAARADVWRRLKLLDGLTIHGARPGAYSDPNNPKGKVQVTSQDALFRITGKRLPEQGSFDPEQVPLEVTFVAGPLINAFRGRTDVLTFFGDFLPLAGIPPKQVGGAWARSIGLALNQRWREGAAGVNVTTPGDDNAPCVKWRQYTRRELFGLFEPQPSPASVLEGNDPARARTYWTQAIKRLQHAGVVGHYKEAGATLPRYSWADVWLDERLDIRPGAKWQAQAIEIAGASQKQTRKSRRRP